MVQRKIDMKLKEKKSARIVTFSKRKSGIFKKAMELSILCVAAIAIVVFSVGGNCFTFGHPSFKAVIDKFLHEGLESHRDANKSSTDDEIDKLNHKLIDLKGQLQVEKYRSRILDNDLNKTKLKEGQFPIDCLNLEELKKFKASLEALKANLKVSMNEMEAASSMILLAEEAV